MNLCYEEVPEVGHWISSTCRVREVAQLTDAFLPQFDEITSIRRSVDGSARPGLPSMFWAGACNPAGLIVAPANAYRRMAISFLRLLVGPAGAMR
ncbi:MAG: hypothetical protein CFE49_14580 [Pseudomonas sp. PGPPP3]|nr:MAG: hypothetical protein CFE49_14580 [Pseudomonas sp. PGPPP3]